MTAGSRHVSDQELELAWKNPDYRRVLFKVLGRYRQLDDDTRKELALAALWKALRRHREGGGLKLTTFLYRAAHWEARRELTRRKGRGMRPRPAMVPISLLGHEDRVVAPVDADPEGVRELVEQLPEEDRVLLTLRYLEGRTLREIGGIVGLRRTVLQNRLHEAMGELRKLYRRSLERHGR